MVLAKQKTGKATSSTSSSTLVPLKKLRLRCAYLYEGRKKNDCLSIVSRIYVEKNLELSKLARIHCGRFFLHIEREIIIYAVKLKKAPEVRSHDRLSLMIVSTVRLQNDNILIVSDKF